MKYQFPLALQAYLWPVVWLTSFFFLTQTYAAPPGQYYDLPKLVAIQNRPYYVNKDLTLQIGVLPSDPFNTGLTTGLTYTHYFKDYIGWEIVNINYNFNKETSLKQDINNLNVDINKDLNNRLDYMTYYMTTSLVYTPIYAKNLFFNEKVIHGEINFTLGAGLTRLKEVGFRPLIVVGTFLRFFSRPNRSWKFDFRNNIYIDKLTGPINAWSLSIGYSMQLGKKSKNNSR